MKNLVSPSERLKRILRSAQNDNVRQFSISHLMRLWLSHMHEHSFNFTLWPASTQVPPLPGDGSFCLFAAVYDRRCCLLGTCGAHRAPLQPIDPLPAPR